MCPTPDERRSRKKKKSLLHLRLPVGLSHHKKKKDELTQEIQKDRGGTRDTSRHLDRQIHVCIEEMDREKLSGGTRDFSTEEKKAKETEISDPPPSSSTFAILAFFSFFFACP